MVENQGKQWTYEEYYRLEGDQRYEIIEGELTSVLLAGLRFDLSEVL